MKQSSSHPGRRVRDGGEFYGPKFLQLSDLRSQRKCDKVAAVCFRLRSGVLEFLLVRTRSGNWTFPKGNAEPGLTSAQAAALEAFEEAGVHGRMEEISFATYVRRKRASGGSPAGVELVFIAHLCQVLWLDQPQESGRNPTWFTTEKAKRRLCEGRSDHYASELSRVVDHAAKRIRQLSGRRSVLQLPAARNLEVGRTNTPTVIQHFSRSRHHGPE